VGNPREIGLPVEAAGDKLEDAPGDGEGYDDEQLDKR
jgi:hypothetical protein